MKTIVPLISVLLSLIAVPSVQAKSEFNVDYFLGWQGCFRPMEWTPLEIEISNNHLTRPFEGAITVSAPQDGLNRLNVSHSFVLTAAAPQHISLATKIAFTAEKCTLNVVNKRGRSLVRQDINLWDFTREKKLLTIVSDQDLLIGIIGRPSRFNLNKVPNESICKSADDNPGKVYIKAKLPRKAPWDWTGYCSLDLLILYDPDWSLFRVQQIKAICQWVSNGGKLLIILGGHPLPQNSPLTEILPFTIEPLREITLKPETMKLWNLDSSNSETVNAWPLRPKSNAKLYETNYYKVFNNDENLFATAYVGFGHLGIMAFDPGAFSASQKPHATQFWIHHFRAVLEDFYTTPSSLNLSSAESQLPWRIRKKMSTPNSGSINRTINFEKNASEILKDQQFHHQFKISPAHQANNAIMEYFYNIAELKPLSIWWVILLLITLAVLLGPLDYIILKRKGRLPLTWLTSTGWIILFTVGAYFGVQALRGGKMQLRAITVLDGIENSNVAWASTYSGLFAPYSDDYRLKNTSSLKDQQQWWSGIAPTQENIYYYNHQFGTRNIYCYQHDGANIPHSLPINIWTMQCLLNESPQKQIPIQATVEKNQDEISLKITNLSDRPIAKGHVLLAQQKAFYFDSVPAHSTKEFSGILETYTQKNIPKHEHRNSRPYQSNNFRNIPASDSNRKKDYRLQYACKAQGSGQRTRIIDKYLLHGAAVVCAEYRNTALSFSVDKKNCDWNHLQLARLVVFPEDINK